jgi:hypothetical protein
VSRIYIALPFGVREELDPVQLLDRDPYDGPHGWVRGPLVVRRISTPRVEYTQYLIDGKTVDPGTLRREEAATR